MGCFFANFFFLLFIKRILKPILIRGHEIMTQFYNKEIFTLFENVINHHISFNFLQITYSCRFIKILIQTK